MTNTLAKFCTGLSGIVLMLLVCVWKPFGLLL